MKKYLFMALFMFLLATATFSNTLKLSTPANKSTVSNPITFSWSGTDDNCTLNIFTADHSVFVIHNVKTPFVFDNDIRHLLDANTKYYWNVKKDVDAHETSKTFSFTTNSTLPVELNSFNASVNNNSVTLTWSTATEVNNYGFDIERSFDNTNFTKIGFIAGAGNSNSTKNYTYTDIQPDGTNVSYRLKQIDNSGTYAYSDVITVTLNSSNTVQLMNNYPNPFNPSTAIKFYVPNNMNISIEIYNIRGQKIITLENGTQSAGYHIVYWNGKDISGNSVASGIYLYKINAGNFTQTKKMNLLK